MSDTTPLDDAFAAMSAAPEDEAALLAFYARLADSELCLMLTEEPKGETISPEVFPLESGPVALIFDREERLSAFAGRAAPYAALPGRALVQMLAGQGIGLGLNFDVAPSSHLMPPDAVDWLASTLGHAPEEAEARPVEVAAPKGLPEVLLGALDARLARAAGLARKAYLASVTYEGGARGHLLGITGVQPGAEAPLARAVNEALVFSGLEAGALDVAFLEDSSEIAARLASVGLRFDLPEPEAPQRSTPAAPGSDPDKPPRLR